MQENVTVNALIYIATFKLRQYLHGEVLLEANTRFLNVFCNSLYANGLCFPFFLFRHFRFAEKAFQCCGKGSFALQNMLSHMPEKAVLYAERGFPAPEKPVSDSDGCEKTHCGQLSDMP